MKQLLEELGGTVIYVLVGGSFIGIMYLILDKLAGF